MSTGTEGGDEAPRTRSWGDGIDRRAYDAELRASIRRTSLPSGLVGLVAFLAWSGFDRLLEPEHAAHFIAIRIIFEALIASSWLVLRLTRVRGVLAEVLAFSMFGYVQVGVALIVPRAQHAREAYLLGLSFAIYASASLIAWHWRNTLLLIVLTFAATAAASLSAPVPMGWRDHTVVWFYLGTASLLAAAGHGLRYQLGWQEFRTRTALAAERAALEAERRRSAALVAELARLSHEDPLTGLANRRRWEQTLDELFGGRLEEGAAVLLIDLDHFKEINDRLGHGVGDEVLQRVAGAIRDAVSPADCAARLGGDELAVLSVGRGLGEAARLAVAIAQRVSNDVLLPDGGRVSVSIGVATASPGEPDATAVMARADADLYLAKRTRGSVCAGGHRQDVPAPGAGSDVQDSGTGAAVVKRARRG